MFNVGQWPLSGFSQPGLLVSLIGLGNYPQDPSAYGPTRPSHTYGQDEQGYSAGRCEHCLLQTTKKQHNIQYLVSCKVAATSMFSGVFFVYSFVLYFTCAPVCVHLKCIFHVQNILN